ncbi:MAG TPA: hypothetical protein P5076_19185, partial [Myxococcota bacterium]|nr:hypothetical protein [Myxococcota bacterium]
GGNEQADAGDGDVDPGTCVVDNSQPRSDADPNWELTAGGEDKAGLVCPPGDTDYYWFEVASAGTILSVQLANNVPMSPVDLCYTIFPADEGAPAVGGLCDQDGMDGQTDLRGTHYLSQAGLYFLEVRDGSSDEEDARNTYRLNIGEIVDPDTYEPNNTAASAKALQAGVPGYISFLGDKDWYRVEVGQPGQILSLSLTAAQAGPVDLRYTLFRPDGTTVVNTSADLNGMDGATRIEDILPVNTAGTYYLVISDDLDDDSSLEVGYTLTTALELDPDTRDRTSRNDDYTSAVPITSGGAVTQGFLATRADEDWYRLEAAGVSDTAPALIEVELNLDPASPVDPAVDLILGDPRTACQAGDPCDLLSSSCGGGCENTACANAQCPSHECVLNENRCRGGGFCLPEGLCAIRHLVLHGTDWSPSGDPHVLRTVAPMYGSVYYVVVRDFQSDDLDPDRAYTLTVTVHPEPDTYEPNGVYLPYATNEQEEEARNANPARSSPVTCSDDGTTVTCGPITGYLSYRGDQDWYELDSIPDLAELTPNALSTKVDWDLRFQYAFAGLASMEVYYTLFMGSGDESAMRSGMCATPGPSAHEGGCYTNSSSGTMGESDCSYICGEYHGGRPVYLRVMHYDRKLYDFQNAYTVTIRAIRGCPQTCEWCLPTTVDYACPNPGNPNPGG